jgi:hypothetical protein
MRIRSPSNRTQIHCAIEETTCREVRLLVQAPEEMYKYCKLISESVTAVSKSPSISELLITPPIRMIHLTRLRSRELFKA